MTKHYQTDILIIGGGPAGGTAALTAQKFGLRSIIVEREQFPRDKVCGDAIVASSIFPIFNDIAPQITAKLTAEKKIINRFDIHGKFRLENVVPVFLEKRKTFDNLLWSHIPQNNTSIKFDKSFVSQIKHEKNEYFIQITHENEQIEINAKYLIGADGYSSKVKRLFFKDVEFNHRIASRHYLNQPLNQKEDLVFYFDEEIYAGYFWCFKIAENQYNTGCYLDFESKEKIKDLHRYFLQKHFAVSISENQIDTWTIPTNTALDKLVQNNAILVGDAAGLCDTIFGHGIDSAIISGYLAVKSIHDFTHLSLPYALEEMYTYNLNSYLKKLLDSSKTLFENLRENPERLHESLTHLFNE